MPHKSLNHINEIILKHLIAQQSVKVGNEKKALQLCDEILSIDSLSNYAKDRLDDRLKRVKEFRSSLIK